MGGTYLYAPDIWLPLAGSIFLAGLCVYSWKRRSVPAALPLFAGALFAALWLMGIAFAATAVAPATKIAWHKFQAAWHLPSATCMLCFALEYVYPGRWLTRRTLALLALPPLLVIVLIGANAGQLMWGRLEVAPDGAIVRNFTAAGTILMIYGLSLALVNVAAYVWLFIRSPQHRQPVALLLAGDIAARSLYGLYQLDAGVRSLSLHDAFVIGLLLDWSMYALALFGFRIFDPLLAAQAAALVQMPEGMAVFDAQWRVVSLNPAAATMLSISAGRARHKLLAEVLPEYCDEVARCPDRDSAPAEISLKTRNGVRQVALDFTVLQDFRGLTIGRLLMLRDVTEWRREQARAVEHQRRLAVIHERERMARELHDNLGQVLAFVTTQGQTVRRLLASGDIAQADDQVERLVEVAGEANADVRESILGLQVTFDTPRLLPALATYLDRYEKHYGIHTALSTPQSLANDAFEPLAEVHVLRIVQEALTNARKHAQASSVCVTLALADGHAQVTVQDDGCGFDLEAVAGSSGGVGLRVMRERAEEIGGTVAVKSAAGAGTQVVLTVPLQAASR